jgi:hypothetical protein
MSVGYLGVVRAHEATSFTIFHHQGSSFLIALITRGNGPSKQRRADAFSTERRGGLYSGR